MKNPLLFFCCLIPILLPARADTTVIVATKLMGSRFVFTAVHGNADSALAAINAGITEVARVEALISTWQPGSEASAVNRAAGIAPVQLSEETFGLIRRCLRVAELTGGAFDPTFAAYDGLWRFDGRMSAPPSDSAIQQRLPLAGWQKVQCDTARHTVFLPLYGMKLGFGAIGKGYAAERAKAVMVQAGIRSGIVNAGGDLLCWGDDPEVAGGGWNIAIANPRQREKAMAWVRVKNQAIVTSGNYEKFFDWQGRRYAHILDPRTGHPAEGVLSTTVICPNAELADALATALFVLGPTDGLALIGQLNGVEGIVITALEEIKISDNLQLQWE